MMPSCKGAGAGPSKPDTGSTPFQRRKKKVGDAPGIAPKSVLGSAAAGRAKTPVPLLSVTRAP
jgi:hypothetical protein